MGEMRQKTLLKKGAEASLYLVHWHNRKAVMKSRLPKRYRLTELDERIRMYRTIHEPKLIHEAKKAGVSTPTVLWIDTKSAIIVMEFVEGKQLKLLLGEASKDERQSLCSMIGELIGRLHKFGIIHGDLTTSNMILSSRGRIFFLDFGLGEKADNLEARGVDLHLMKRALESTHFRVAGECFNSILGGYSKICSSQTAEKVLDKIREIERRGRYVSERKNERKN